MTLKMNGKETILKIREKGFKQSRYEEVFTKSISENIPLIYSLD